MSFRIFALSFLDGLASVNTSRLCSIDRRRSYCHGCSLLRAAANSGVGGAPFLSQTADYGKYFFKLAEPVPGNKYTTKPLRTRKTAGRDEHGIIRNRMLGGGIKMDYYMVDHKRPGPSEEGSFRVEKVMDIRECYFRTGYIALLAEGNEKRWITAEASLKVGDLVRTSHFIPKTPVDAKEGDNYPLGALAVNSTVCCVEMVPGKGAWFARTAGSSVKIVRKFGDRVVIRAPSKREFELSEKCMCTFGTVSRAEWNTLEIGSAGNMRKLGFRPGTGLWHRKDGYCGRKIRPPKPLVVIKGPKEKEYETKRFTFASNQHLRPFIGQVNPKVCLT